MTGKLLFFFLHKMLKGDCISLPEALGESKSKETLKTSRERERERKLREKQATGDRERLSLKEGQQQGHDDLHVSCGLPADRSLPAGDWTSLRGRFQTAGSFSPR